MFTLTLWIITGSDWSDGWGSLSLSDQLHAHIRFTLHLYSLPLDRARPHLEVPSNRATVNSNHWLHFSLAHTHTRSQYYLRVDVFFMLLPQGLEFAAEEAGRWAKSLFCVRSGWYEMGGLEMGDGTWRIKPRVKGLWISTWRANRKKIENKRQLNCEEKMIVLANPCERKWRNGCEGSERIAWVGWLWSTLLTIKRDEIVWVGWWCWIPRRWLWDGGIPHGGRHWVALLPRDDWGTPHQQVSSQLLKKWDLLTFKITFSVTFSSKNYCLKSKKVTWLKLSKISTR